MIVFICCVWLYLYVVEFYMNNYTILTRIPIKLKVATTNVNVNNESPWYDDSIILTNL